MQIVERHKLITPAAAGAKRPAQTPLPSQPAPAMRSTDVVMGEGNEGESGEGQNLPSLSDLRLQAAAVQGGLLDY